VQKPTPTEHFWLVQMLSNFGISGQNKTYNLYFLPTPCPKTLPHHCCWVIGFVFTLAYTILLSETAHNKFNVAEADATIQWRSPGDEWGVNPPCGKCDV